MNKQKNIASVVAIGILIIGASFYGGMVYGKKTISSQIGQNRQAANLGGASGQRGMGARGGQGQGMNGGAGEFAGGEITAKDDTSITIKTRNGSSQIIFYSSGTLVDKSVSGSASDLNIGQQITVSGKNNPDGTLAAQNIQIRPSEPKQAQ